MKNFKYFSFLFIGLAAVCVGCQSNEDEDDDVDFDFEVGEITSLEITANQKEALNCQEDFCIDLFKAMDEDVDANFMISPLSVTMATSILANGVDAETQNNMVEKLGFESLADLNEFNHYLLNALPKADPSYVKVSLANAVWANSQYVSKIDTKFSDVLENTYLGAARLSDFSKTKSLAKEINEWCAQKTYNYIPEIITKDQINSSQTLFVLNALYFKGQWASPFDKENTESSKFYDANGKNVCNVDMMYMPDKYKRYSETSVAQSIY